MAISHNAIAHALICVRGVEKSSKLVQWR
ncbi:hypothetical protein CCACVL1_12437 [Corchorus capsularis]|uniref:Uncharacterized protein n=1 Tax=Corchorus capsularis TaxID=210143 RepID=A0A1R3IFM8_COCAP|nr:hypothetical protein CCACVL1_12437 [Corchorus capsularis]